MDSITQITLGAAVGEAMLGKKLGNKGAAWGAAFGLLPDLDVIAIPFLSNVEALSFHRGISHSIFFSVIAAPLFGWLLYRYYGEKAQLREWSLMVFLALITHIFIDACTSYGTQVFQPFSNYALSFNSIFIIDPFYTLPLVAGLLAALFMKRASSSRRWANYIGLGISSAYLITGFVVKAHVNSVFEDNFHAQNLSIERYMTTPMPFTQFLWVTYAETDDKIYAGLYSIFDDDREIHFQSIDKNANLISKYRDQLPVLRILWFSQGYYSASHEDDGLYLHDLRFGRTDQWLENHPSPFVWSYRLIFNDDATKVNGFERAEPNFEINQQKLIQLLNRTFGKV